MKGKPGTPVTQITAEQVERSLPRSSAPTKLAHLVFKTPRLEQMLDWYSICWTRWWCSRIIGWRF